MRKTVSVEEFRASAGRELEPSNWLEITQQRVDQFAEATNDHQFIHVDPQQAAKTVFGGTIAHGFLTLSLLSYLNFDSVLIPEGTTMVINYGSNQVRFLAPVRVGSRIRSQQKILEVSKKSSGTWLMKTACTVEIENGSKPAMKAELLTLYIVR